ncbi:MAG: amidase [Parerythrobacter sp.]
MTDPYNAFLFRDQNASGGGGALAGVTVGVKANIKVQGLPFHSGLAAFADRNADRDAVVVAKLRSAGAAIIGILNMEEAALGAKTDNPHFGATQNPHRKGFSPGGSSGGSGAAVAAGLCDVALGTDTMGSVRIPAAHCGVYGFKPATARVSQDGLDPADASLDAIGPLARSLDMLERVACVMSDMGSGSGDLQGATPVGHGVDTNAAVSQAFATVLASLPAAPAEAHLPHPLSRVRFAGFRGVSQSLAYHLADTPNMSARLAKLLEYGPARTAEQVAEDHAILSETRDRVLELVDRHGWLLMPTVPNPPFAHAAPEPAAQADFTCLANIAGLPALSLPMGWTADGLPLGVQIVARDGYEAGMFALARHLDINFGAYRAPHNWE